MYARVEIIAKLREKNVTASTGIKLVHSLVGGLEEHVRITLIFSRIISFILFTLSFGCGMPIFNA